ncbi:MAG: hypothetical protein ACM3U0_02035 [archaeon]
MSGKAALILVIGFSLIYLLIAHFWNSVTKRAVINNTEYFSGTVAHNIAVSGANIKLNKIYLGGWSPDPVTRSFERGNMSVTAAETDTMTRIITSVGTFNGSTRTVIVKTMRSSFAKYAWFTGSVSSSKIFITGDTIWGGMHSNQRLNIEGSPVFFGKVTTSKGLSPSPFQMLRNGYHPQFLGGYGTGVSVEFDNNYQFQAQRSAAISAGRYFTNTDVWLTFYSDGTVSYRTGIGNDSSTYTAPIRTPISTLTSNGVIFADKGNIYLSGTLKGEVTVVADQSSGTGGGNVYFVDNMTYSTEPMIRTSISDYTPNENCTDLMGVLASNNAVVATAVSNSGKLNNVINKDINIDAGIFCAKGGLTVENWTDVPGPAGVFTLRGSMIAGTEEKIAILNNSHVLVKGYKRRVIFDERFYVKAPLYFPLSSEYNIVSWLE